MDLNSKNHCIKIIIIFVVLLYIHAETHTERTLQFSWFQSNYCFRSSFRLFVLCGLSFRYCRWLLCLLSLRNELNILITLGAEVLNCGHFSTLQSISISIFLNQNHSHRGVGELYDLIWHMNGPKFMHTKLIHPLRVFCSSTPCECALWTCSSWIQNRIIIMQFIMTTFRIICAVNVLNCKAEIRKWTMD